MGDTSATITRSPALPIRQFSAPIGKFDGFCLFEDILMVQCVFCIDRTMNACLRARVTQVIESARVSSSNRESEIELVTFSKSTDGELIVGDGNTSPVIS